MARSANKGPWPAVSNGFVRRLLDGHKVLGLALCGILYLICLTGTIGVYYVEFERWERPNVPEFTHIDPDAAARAIADTRSVMLADTHKAPTDTSIFVGMPNERMPRLIGGYGHEARAYDAEGRYLAPAGHDLTHFLTELHYYLHLPETFGMIVVCLFGVGMMALLIGGALAHPRMFKDAFTLRVRGQGPLTRSDVHNRIGTWTLPFGLMVTLTGTIIGLAQLLALALGALAYDGNALKTYEPIFGSEAETLAATGGQPLQGEQAIANALRQVRAAQPDQPLSYAIIQNVGTPKEALEIITLPPNRLVYGETWRFDAAGNLVGSHNLSDGPAGRQIAASVYSLHFGNFGGPIVKLAYVIFGLALVIMIAAGMDIWLIKSAAKGRARPGLHRLWIVLVYGSPAAIALTMALCLPTGWNPVAVFWSLLVGMGVLSLISMAFSAASHRVVSRLMRALLGLSVLAVPIVHQLVNRSWSTAAVQINLALVLIGLGLVLTTWHAARKKPENSA